MNRFYFQESLRQGLQCDLPALMAHQVLHVLRMQAGESVLLFNDQDGEYLATISQTGKHTVRVGIEAKTRDAYPSSLNLRVYLPLIKPRQLELAIQKLTELGVGRISLLVSQHAQRREIQLERLHVIAREAVEQSEQFALPQIDAPVAFATALHADSRLCFMAVERSSAAGLITLLHQHTSAEGAAVMIGPEGGWSAEEIRAAAAAGVLAFSLGREILRSETAAIVVAALFKYCSTS